MRSKLIKSFHQQHEVERFFHQGVERWVRGGRVVLLEPRSHGDDRKVRSQGVKMPDSIPRTFLPGVEVEENDVDRLIERLRLKFVKRLLVISGWNDSEIFDCQSLAKRLAHHQIGFN